MPTPFKKLLTLIVIAATPFLVSHGIIAATSKGIATITSSPEGATVYIAGREYGPTPVAVELQSGQHIATISLDGYPPQRRVLEVAAGRTTAARVTFLDVLPKSGIRVHNTETGGADAGPGTVTIVTDPPSLTVYMNDIRVPKTTPVVFDIRAGIYQLRIEQRGIAMVKKTVFVRAGRTVDLTFAVRQRREIDINDPWQ